MESIDKEFEAIYRDIVDKTGINKWYFARQLGRRLSYIAGYKEDITFNMNKYKLTDSIYIIYSSDSDIESIVKYIAYTDRAHILKTG